MAGTEEAEEVDAGEADTEKAEMEAKEEQYNRLLHVTCILKKQKFLNTFVLSLLTPLVLFFLFLNFNYMCYL